MDSLTKILSLIVLIVLGLIFIPGRLTHEKFDSKIWKEWRETEETATLRWDMLNSLRNKYELKGKTEDQILELLGIPETKFDNTFNYYLGLSKQGINTGTLQIEFDSNKLVKRFRVLQG